MVHDLCIIMLTAGITSLLFKLLKQPVVLGYIVAGMIVGPHVFGESWISNEESVNTWGQIGVLFLLFAMGLEFSFKKLLQVGSTVLVAAAVIVVGMMATGFIVGRLFGWNEINSLFLGGMLSMSSTTIVFKALDDMGLRNHKFAKICFGILVVEDLFAVVLMVVLSSIATSRTFEGGALLFEVCKLIAYLVLWFVIGIAVIPSFLRYFRKYLNDETLTIFSVGLCLGMVLLAVGAGFSSALGAFVMGSVLAETVEAERIENLVQPVKNIFGSIFFVSVGMMIDPRQLVEHAVPILILTGVVIVGQIVFATLGTLLSGQSLKVSMQTGFSLVQIGEFAFIIAALGQSLKVTDTSLYPIVVAVSVITTFLTPFIIRLAEPAYQWVDAHLSPGVRLFLENYARNRSTVMMQSTFQRLARRMLTTIFIMGILLTFIYLLFFKSIFPWFERMAPDSFPVWLVDAIELVVLLLFSSPFIYAMANTQRKSPESRELWRSGNFQKAQLIALSLVRILVPVLFVAYAVIGIFSVTSGVVVIAAFLLFCGILMSRRIRKNAARLTAQFNMNLSAREVSAEKKRAVSRNFTNSLLDYDVHISEFQLPAASSLCGKSLKAINVRSHTGASIVRIVRSGININIPGGNVVVYPGDKIIVAGSDEQIDKFKQLLDNSLIAPEQANEGKRTHVTLERFTVSPESRLIGTTIMQSHIREQAHCVIIAIERGGKLITNPDPSLAFQASDVIIAAGESDRLKEFAKQNS